MARLTAILAISPALLAFILQFGSTAATPLSSITPREDDTGANDLTGYPRCWLNNKCPGLWPAVTPSTPKSENETLFASINDAGLLASAALKAIEAPHFDYFFERTPAVTTFLTTVFSNIADCANGKKCRFSNVYADINKARGYGWCDNPAKYSYATSTHETSAAGGGISWLCPKGLALPRNPSPCTTNGNPTISLGFALLRVLVQEPQIIDPDNSGALFDDLPVTSITETNNAGDWDLAKLGWGDDGNGLMAKGIGNAANLAYFATLSWDLGYGPPPANGTTCQSRWTKFAASKGLVPIS